MRHRLTYTNKTTTKTLTLSSKAKLKINMLDYIPQKRYYNLYMLHVQSIYYYTNSTNLDTVYKCFLVIYIILP